VQVEDGLAGAGADEDHQPVLVEPSFLGTVGDEVEHPLVLVGGELADVAEGLDVVLGDDQQVDVRLRVDVLDRDEALGAVDLARRRRAGVDLAEDAVVRQRGSPPP
jgi:hypothetical protein